MMPEVIRVLARVTCVLTALICLLAVSQGCVNRSDRALSAAIARKDFATAERLIREGGDVDYSEVPERETTLMIMSTTNEAEAVRFLLEHKASVNLRNRRGMTALMYAAWKGRVDNIKLLAAAGVDLDATADEGQTAVSIAKAAKQDEAVELLLALGAKDVPARAIFRGA